ncbi:MAG: hypothetical protein M0P12_02480 [Paludibacteraceae bacterium]|nr:hypothetical protein [Paludibacteraceae bacterium]
MKILFYHSCSFYKAPFCELIDEAEKLSREGNEVYFATCNGVMNCCFSNPTNNKYDCDVCNFSVKKSLKLLSNANIIDLKKYLVEKAYDWQYSNVTELKHVKYKEVQIGFAVVSYYISKTRNLNPKITSETKQYFDGLLTQASRLTDALDNLIKEIAPDKICIFNGRFFETRPAYELALNKNIPIDIYELIGGRKAPYYKVIFQNSLPHNLPYLKKLINSGWENSTKTEEEKTKIGKSFFERRRNGIEAGDKVYIGNQVAGMLPSNWDKSKKNVVIFNSSEDEFASVGDEYDKYALFPSQMEGIRSILEMHAGNDNIHFYLRIHPNLTNIKYRYHTDLYDIDKEFDNITIIPAGEKISTYALMDEADKVIVFGSTTGIEAAYWNKPVILLAGAIYYFDDVCYVPQTKEELKELVETENLPSKKEEETCLKFGFYFLDTERSISKNSYHYFNYNSYDVTFGGMTFHGTYCQKMLGSHKLYAYVIAFMRFVALKLFKNKTVIPTEEA